MQAPYKLNDIRRLLTPSGLSGLVSILLSASVVIATILSARFQGSAMQRVVLEWQADARLQTFNDPFHAASIDDTINLVISTIYTFLFWAALATLVVVIIAGIAGGIRAIKEFLQALTYVNLNRKAWLWQQLAHIAVRLVALVVLYVVLRLLVGVLLVAALTAALAAAGHLSSVQGIIQGFVGWLVLVAGMHGVVVLVRVVALRPRLFG